MFVLVPSTAKYFDAWRPFVALARIYWPNRTWPLVLATDGGEALLKEHAAGFDEVRAVPEDLGWSRNVLAALKGEKADELCLFMQEDFFLSAPVDVDALKDATKFLQKNADAACMRVFPCPGPAGSAEHGKVGRHAFGEVLKGEPYRISCQAAVWRVSALRKALCAAPTPFGFEIRGTEACVNWPERFWSVHRGPQPWPVEYVCSAINRGRWDQTALDLCARHGIPVEAGRPVDKRA